MMPRNQPHDGPGQGKPTDSVLLTILKVGHETSMRGSGISLRQALRESRYADLRPRFEARDLLPFIRADRELVDQWMMYSDDKRTNGGWYLLPDGSAGRASDSVPCARFGTMEEAVTEYVVKELDFWARLGAAR